MAKRVKHSTDRSRLVDGCGNILVTDRLTGGYKLVKRKRGAKATTTSTKRKAGRPKGSKNKSKATAPVMATKRSVGRPRKMREEVIVVTTTTAPTKRKAGRPRKMATAPVMATKGKVGRPKGSTKKSSAPQKARRVSKKMA
jgi:hypothetical protein